MKSLDFKISDLNDYEGYYKRAKAEAKLCYDTPSTRRGRSWENLFRSYLQGHGPEYYLMENFGFTDDSKFHDLLNNDGTPVEIKTTIHESNVRDTILKLNELKLTKKYRKVPNIIYMWLVDDIIGAYKYYAKYEWKQGRFVITSTSTL